MLTRCSCGEAFYTQKVGTLIYRAKDLARASARRMGLAFPLQTVECPRCRKILALRADTETWRNVAISARGLEGFLQWIRKDRSKKPL
jgi:hypothetical protein